jgi:hypothetical protein
VALITNFDLILLQGGDRHLLMEDDPESVALEQARGAHVRFKRNMQPRVCVSSSAQAVFRTTNKGQSQGDQVRID